MSVQKQWILAQSMCRGEALAKTEGLSYSDTAAIACALCRGFQKSKNGTQGQQMPLVNGHYFFPRPSADAIYEVGIQQFIGVSILGAD